MTESDRLFARAQKVLPGGVSSPVRAFKAVGGSPIFMASGKGAALTDVDGRTFIDMAGSWGPLILGHAHPVVVKAIETAAAKGTSFGTPIEVELDLAELIVDAVASIEQVRFVSSGTEASMSAIRLARAATGRSKILKFAGCYHGHADCLLVSAGSGPATLGLPDSPGVTDGARLDTVVCTFNSLGETQEAFQKFGRELAAVIVEPVAANMGVVPPAPGFLQALRQLCNEAGALLIFDEVITGFRLSYGGAQGLFGIEPDLTILGKVIGGGLPVGAYGGKARFMELVAPLGPVYQAGTLSGNPVCMAAGSATLGLLKADGQDPGSGLAAYRQLEQLGYQLESGLKAEAKRAGIDVRIHRVGSALTVFFTLTKVVDLETAKSSDTDKFALFFHALLNQGVYWPPSQFEASFISAAHTPSDIDQVIRAAGAAFDKIR
ncbi:MAG: glutamate-1-semialdehyde 2,1-aminomutase [Actinomycetota bacterium]